jgi:hypothetical protein
MKRSFYFTLVVVLGLLAVVPSRQAGGADATKPTDGWTLHIDAKLHFPGKPQMIAHHYCKPVSGGLTECQLYDSDAADARLVGVEVIVAPDVYKKFSSAEKKLWHYHKIEIPKVSATLPDVSQEEGARVLKSIEETYGKVYVLWPPWLPSGPVGRPTVSILK